VSVLRARRLVVIEVLSVRGEGEARHQVTQYFSIDGTRLLAEREELSHDQMVERLRPADPGLHPRRKSA
jgi:hypothetical protein